MRLRRSRAQRPEWDTSARDPACPGFAPSRSFCPDRALDLTGSSGQGIGAGRPVSDPDGVADRHNRCEVHRPAFAVVAPLSPGPGNEAVGVK